MMESEEIHFVAAFGNETADCYLWRQKGGNYFDVYINGFYSGGIIKYDGGWMVKLNGDKFNQGDSDELLQIAGIDISEKFPVAGYVERRGAIINPNAFKTMWTDSPIDHNEKSPN